ncbi:MAG TPA: hypothetical protein VL918_13350 [Sphingobium sp.]|nr:hypothetical protein [Sphingobium sp.]
MSAIAASPLEYVGQQASAPEALFGQNYGKIKNGFERGIVEKNAQISSAVAQRLATAVEDEAFA